MRDKPPLTQAVLTAAEHCFGVGNCGWRSCPQSVGVGGGIAGFGAGLVVIDDPVRNRADAESEVFRSRVWDWFNDDIYTRLSLMRRSFSFRRVGMRMIWRGVC